MKPIHLVTPQDYVDLICDIRRPKRVTISESPMAVEITIERTRWQRWTVNKTRWKQQIENEIGRRKMVGLQVEVIML